MRPTPRNELEAISVAFRKVASVYSRWAQRYNLSAPTVLIFHKLYDGGALTQNFIGECMKMPKQSVNKIIKAMQDDGYVSLTASEQDKREKLIRLTDKGREHVELLLGPLFRVEENTIRKVGHKHIQQLIEAVELYALVFQEEVEKEESMLMGSK